MSGDTVQAGDAFFFDPNGRAADHLWVVLAIHTPEMAYEAYAALVNVTSITKSITKKADRTCVLRPSDDDAHPFVQHESYVFYGGIEEVEVAELLRLGAGKGRDPVSPALLSRMRTGAHHSPFTRRGFKAWIPQS